MEEELMKAKYTMGKLMEDGYTMEEAKAQILAKMDNIEIVQMSQEDLTRKYREKWNNKEQKWEK